MKRKAYAQALEALQVELNHLARWLQATGERLVVVLEGRDTAGKGGTINAITERMNPRQVHVVALPKPTDRERSQWYFQRFTAHLPAAGEFVVFDRSWYNRAGVERVMGYCSTAEYEAFLREAPMFERSLVESGIRLHKYWLCVDQVEQERRFARRAADPLRRWKLSPVDLEARSRYRDYGQARDRMLEATHTAWAPWTLVDYNDKRSGRLALLGHLLEQLPPREVEDQPIQLPALDGPPARETYGTTLRPINAADD